MHCIFVLTDASGRSYPHLERETHVSSIWPLSATFCHLDPPLQLPCFPTERRGSSLTRDQTQTSNRDFWRGALSRPAPRLIQGPQACPGAAPWLCWPAYALLDRSKASQGGHLQPCRPCNRTAGDPPADYAECDGVGPAPGAQQPPRRPTSRPGTPHPRLPAAYSGKRAGICIRLRDFAFPRCCRISRCAP